MTASRKKITFISHDASLTGAPILLLHLMRLLIKHDLFDVQVLLYRAGALEEAFKAAAPTLVLKTAGYSKEKRSIPRTWNYFRYRIRLNKAFSAAGQADLLFCNTVATGPLLKELLALNKPVVTYVHELESVIRELDKDGGASLVLRSSKNIIVPSVAVSNNLKLLHGVSPGRISFLNYFLAPPDLAGASMTEVRGTLFKLWNIPPDKFYVVGMGVATYRKGIDLFLAIAQEAVRRADNIHFVWIGDYEHEAGRKYIHEKIDEYKMTDRITMTGPMPYAPTNLIPFDLFALTSREDPYPLVLVEAAYAGLPAVCFEDTGGATEFIADDCGWVIPQQSVKQFAAKVLELNEDRATVRARGAKARAKALERHANEAHICGQFTSIVTKVLNQ